MGKSGDFALLGHQQPNLCWGDQLAQRSIPSSTLLDKSLPKKPPSWLDFVAGSTGLGFDFIQPKWWCRRPVPDAATWKNVRAHSQPSTSLRCAVMLSHASEAMLCCSSVPP
ncbi:hypothetical protein FSOLCH5_001251 [Fusarium solani]|nr:hypothetical protein NW759_007477 [Fusarium solani]